MESKASVVWEGGIKQGKGKISTESGVLKDSVYSYGTRFEQDPGTNPEELIAAAHAGCFSMALANELGQAGVTPERIQTTATVTLSTAGNDIKITQVNLMVRAKLPDNDSAVFEKAANQAKNNCPVSKLLNADIKMDAQLIN